MPDTNEDYNTNPNRDTTNPRFDGTEGMSVEEMNARLVQMGFAPRAGAGTNKRQRVVRLSDEAYNGLMEIAAQFNFHWGEATSLSAFLEALGQGVFDVTVKRYE